MVAKQTGKTASGRVRRRQPASAARGSRPAGRRPTAAGGRAPRVDLARLVFDQADQAQVVLEIQAGGRAVVVDANAAALRAHGCSRPELVGTEVPLFDPALDAGTLRDRERVLREGGNVVFEAQYRRPDGSTFHAGVRASRLPVSTRTLVLCTEHDLAARGQTEQALRASESRYRALVDHLDVGVFLCNLEGRLQHVNPETVRMSGYASLEEFISAPSRRLYAIPEDRDRFLRRLFSEGRVHAFDTLSVKKDGTTYPVRLGAVLQRDEAGRPDYILGTIEDLTAVRSTEDQVRLLKHSIDVAPAPAYWFDAEGRFLYVNEAGRRALGYSHDEMLRMRVQDINPRATPERWAAVWQRLRDEGPSTIVSQHRRKDGSVFPVELTSAYFRFGDREYCNGFAVDITERTQAERDKELARQRLALHVQQTPLAVIEFGMDGRVLEWNPAAERVFGYARAEAVGQHWTFIVPEAARPQLDGVWDAILQKRGGSRSTNENRTRSGATIHCEWFNTPLVSHDGAPVGVASLVMDVTDARRAEGEREELQAQLLQAQKMESVGRLAGGVAHDFNNMLAAIMGHADMALDQVTPAHPLHADLTQILRAAERSKDLTRQLLAFARRQTAAPAVLDLDATVDSLLKMLRRLIGEDIRLVFHPGSAPWQVRVDPTQVNQVLANLCVNARDAIDGTGEITITTENVTLAAPPGPPHTGCGPGDYVMLTVSDDGGGMGPETLARLFEPFFTTKEIGKGTGLGLATVYGIVRQNGGTIDVSSSVGAGTTFSIYLPRHAGAAATAHAPTPAPSVPGGRETILLVEDEPAVLNLAARMLELGGYRVLPAGTPTLAQQAAAEHAGPIDLLVADVVMPEMNGRELADRLAQRIPGLRRLFISGYTADVIARHGVLEPGIHFLQKPFTASELYGKVREALEDVAITVARPAHPA